MKLSYTHANKKYSVVVLKDGSVMEIRRGDMTFAGAAADRKTWASVDAWKATWPETATPTPIVTLKSTPKSKEPTPKPKAPKRKASKVHPIIQHYLAKEPSTIRYENGPKRCRAPAIYVSFRGNMLSVYHSKSLNLVLVSYYDPSSNEVKLLPPVALGISVSKSKFYRPFGDVYIPLE